MKDLVIKYLNDNYKLTLSTYVSYSVIEILTGNSISLKEVLNQISLIFSLNDEEQSNFFNEWADIKAIELNNLIVDIQEKMYNLTGKTIDIHPSDMNGIINHGDNLDQFIRNYIVL